MPAVKTGMTPPPMPGMPAPMQPMGGMPPMQNPFAPMPPMPLAGAPMPQPPMPMPPMPQGQQQQMMGSTAGRRRKFGDALEGMLGRNQQGLGATLQGQAQLPVGQRMMPQMMPQQRMVAPGTPMMRTPPMQSMTARPMEMGGEVDIFGYEYGGPVVQYYDGAGEVKSFENIYDKMKGSGAAVDVALKYFDRTGKVLDGYENLIDAYRTTKPSDSSQAQSFLSDSQAQSGGSSAIGASLGGGPEQYTSFIESSLSNVPASAFDVGKTTQDSNSNVRDLLSSLPQSVLTATGLDPNFEADGATGYYRQLNKIRNSGLGRLEKDALLNAMQVAHTAGYGDPDAYNPIADTMKTVQGTAGYAMQKRQQLSQGITRHSADRYMSDEELAIHNQQFMPEPVSQPVSSITGAQAGAGSAVGAGGNFGTGSYTADAVDASEVNPIDYSQFTGDVGSTTGGYDTVDAETGVVTPGTRGQAALFGPRINIPTSVSQYYTDPVTGGLTTSYGPEMVTTSPIGAIKLPARPVSIDIFDWLSTPTYGTMYSGIDTGDVDLFEYDGVNNMRMGGEVSGPFGGSSVPREAMIADEPHMLAYINQDEEALLRSFGGSGISGPGGIPSYPPESAINRDYGYTSSGFSAADATADDDKPSKKAGQSSIGSSGYTSLDAIANAAVQDDDDTSFSYGGQSFDNVFDYHDAIFGGDDSSNVTSAPVGEVDFTTINPATGQQTTVATIDYGDDDDGPVIKDVTYYDDTGTTEIDTPVVTTDTAYVDPNTGSVTYTDRFGREHATQTEANIANRMYDAQMASYGAGKVGFDRFKSDAAETFPGRSREETDRMAARTYPDFVENYSRDINIFDADVPQPFTYTGIGAIGAGPEGGSLGVTPASATSPELLGAESGLFQSDADTALSKASQPVISLDAPVRTDTGAGDPRGNQIVSPTGTGIGRESDLQRGLGATGPIAARDADMDPFGTGTQLSLQDVKDRVARAEGTADEGGYGRLLGGQEGRFGVDLTNMTVQEVLDFQKQRGPGSYAEYSQGVNEQRGMTRADGSGVISTPAGKYQVVGATLEDLIDKGIVDPNAKFDEGTQEKIGSYLIAERRGLNDLQAGNITREQFEENLGKEFEGIKRGLDKGAGSTALTIGAASETGRQAEVDRRDSNVEKIQQQIGDQAEPTGGEKLFYDFVGQLGFGLGKPLADKLRGASREDRQAIIDQHLYALENGATPKTDEEGNYVGFDISTMDTFADKVLGAEDITKFLPGGAEDADGDGVPDYVRFGQVYDAQSTAAAEDPYGYSTEQGFITSDGKEFFVDATGNVVEITDGTVPFEVGGGEDVAAALGVTETTTGGEDSGETKNYTTDADGNKVCNDEGYVYNPETDMCEPPAEEEKSETISSPISTRTPMRSFEDILAGITTPAPKIAPISANIRPMQGGGMVGLNRAADNFIKALAG